MDIQRVTKGSKRLRFNFFFLLRDRGRTSSMKDTQSGSHRREEKKEHGHRRDEERGAERERRRSAEVGGVQVAVSR